MEPLRLIILVVLLGVLVLLLMRVFGPSQGSVTNSVVVDDRSGESFVEDTRTSEEIAATPPIEITEQDDEALLTAENETSNTQTVKKIERSSTRTISQAESIRLPLPGSAPTESVRHSIPIEEIRRGCFRQDCIPSVDNPVFISVDEANDLLPENTVGISLDYKGVNRFYPFNMLVTREIVNDVVAGDPLLVTYCPLCGTGIVFDRTIDGKAYEFGVSGMLWQSNLLMYNRAPSVSDRNLWSQVLGEAVVGVRTGTSLSIIPSNIVRYVDWRDNYQNGEVLNTGRIGDPYDGRYYEVARNFAPNFDELNSLLDPSAYVFGVDIDGEFQAYPLNGLPVGSITDVVNGETLTVTRTEDDEITITDSNGNIVPVVAGFWFSWIAAHPETSLWEPN